MLLKILTSIVDRPTVATADVDSKRVSKKGISSKNMSTVVKVITIMALRLTMARDLIMVWWGILLLKTTACSVPLICEITATKITPKVVSLTPPPVEPGAAPINIRKIAIALVISFMLPVSMVLKPEVRVVTD